MDLVPFRANNLLAQLGPAAAVALQQGVLPAVQQALVRGMRARFEQGIDRVLGGDGPARGGRRRGAYEQAPPRVEELDDDEEAGAGPAAVPPGPRMVPRRRAVPVGAGPAAVPPGPPGRPPAIPPFLPTFEPSFGSNSREYLPVYKPLVAYNHTPYQLYQLPIADRWNSATPGLFPLSYPLIFENLADLAAGSTVDWNGPCLFAPKRGVRSSERLGASIRCLFFRFSLSIRVYWDLGPGNPTRTLFYKGGSVTPYTPPLLDSATFMLLITSDSSPNGYDGVTYPDKFFLGDPDSTVYGGINATFTAVRQSDLVPTAPFYPSVAVGLEPVIPPCYTLIHAQVIRVTRRSDLLTAGDTGYAHLVHDLPIPATLTVDEPASDTPGPAPPAGFCGPPLRMHLVPLAPFCFAPFDVSGCGSLVFHP